MIDRNTILIGDVLDGLATMPDAAVQCCVTSPPYYGLRDYGVAGQIGLEPTPDAYVAKMVEVFREVRRVLRDDGVLFLNLGDSYTSGGRKTRDPGQSKIHPAYEEAFVEGGRADTPPGLKPKDLLGIPWRVALALQADGWYLRQDIIWHKPNPMPESVRDRCTKAHEYIFLMSKSDRYFYDAEAISEPVAESTIDRLSQATLGQQEGSSRVPGKTNGNMKAVPPRFGGNKYGNNDSELMRTKSGNEYVIAENGRRNRRSVWTIPTHGFKEAHFATFPEEIPRVCIAAGSKPGDLVLDPFMGAGTVGLVARKMGRDYIGCELNPAYAEMARKRIAAYSPLFQETT